MSHDSDTGESYNDDDTRSVDSSNPGSIADWIASDDEGGADAFDDEVEPRALTAEELAREEAAALQEAARFVGGDVNQMGTVLEGKRRRSARTSKGRAPQRYVDTIRGDIERTLAEDVDVDELEELEERDLKRQRTDDDDDSDFAASDSEGCDDE